MEKKKKTFLMRLSRWVEGEEQPARELRSRAESAPRERRYEADGNPEQRRIHSFITSYRIVAVIVCVTIVSVLMYTVFRLPLFGSPDNPASNEVVERYVEKGLEETGAVNIVAGMILDYRAFDTFGESSVLFLAVTSVLILLLRDKNNISAEEDAHTAHEIKIEREMRDPILQRVIALVLPCILLFGVYVVLNGHLSPGGGFSGGAIMGAGFILFSASFGPERLGKIINLRSFRVLTASALMVYALSKAYSFFTGANGLPTGIPLGTPGALLSSGLIFVLDICVGLVVACTMYGFYALFYRGEI